MFTMEQIKGNINSMDRQLLFMIHEQLIELNHNISRLVEASTTNENEQAKEMSDTHNKAPQKRGRRPKTA